MFSMLLLVFGKLQGAMPKSSVRHITDFWPSVSTDRQLWL